MDLLKKRILKDGRVLGDDILMVDSFLNHQIDVDLLSEIGKEFHRLFENDHITKILTVESSGIAVACMAAAEFHVPVVFAKKHKTVNISPDVLSASIASFTHKTTYDVRVSRSYICPGDRILIIDDFLANGQALLGLTKIVKDGGAEVVGAGIVIEKGYQPGGKLLRDTGLRVESLAIVKSMNAEFGVEFE